MTGRNGNKQSAVQGTANNENKPRAATPAKQRETKPRQMKTGLPEALQGGFWELGNSIRSDRRSRITLFLVHHWVKRLVCLEHCFGVFELFGDNLLEYLDSCLVFVWAQFKRDRKRNACFDPRRWAT